MLATDISQQVSYSLLSKSECLFAAIWHNPAGVVTTEDVASYYEVSVEEIIMFLDIHQEEFDIRNDDWTPKDAIRLGMVLNSPVATSIRSLALDVIEAHKCKRKHEQVAFLLQKGNFVEWSNREIAKILECSPTVVGDARKQLEQEGKIIEFKRRKHSRAGKIVERQNQPSSLLMSRSGHEQASNPDSTVELPKVKVTSEDHPRYGQEGVIIDDRPSHWQKLIKFEDGTVEAIAVKDLDAPSTPFGFMSSQSTETAKTATHSPIERIYPKEYALAIAERDEQHKRELERVVEESRIKAEVEAEARAARKVAEQIEVQRAIASAKSEEVKKLQQEVDRLRGLQQLEEENKHLRQEIESLRTQLQQQAVRGWEHPLNKDAEKLLNTEVKSLVKNLEPELHLRSLASQAPSNCEECLRLMAIALGVLGEAMNYPQALEAAAMLLNNRSSGDPPSVSTQHSAYLDEALIQIRSVISDPNCTWDEFWEVAEPYQGVKKEYWRSLSTEEQAFIKKLRNEQDFKEKHGLYPGAWVSGSDPYSTIYNRKGVVERINVDAEQIFVWWRVHEGIPKDRNHYEPNELVVIDTPEEFVEF